MLKSVCLICRCIFLSEIVIIYTIFLRLPFYFVVNEPFECNLEKTKARNRGHKHTEPHSLSACVELSGALREGNLAPSV